MLQPFITGFDTEAAFEQSPAIGIHQKMSHLEKKDKAILVALA